MDTRTEPATPNPSPPPEDTTVADDRPDHTILSIVIMLLLSATALYGVYQVVREPERVVQAWDFTASDSENAWTFPEDAPVPAADGVTIEMPESGFGPELNLEFPADQVGRVRATVSVTHVATGEPARFALGWYWARAEDVAAAPDAPYALDRALAFHAFARHLPHTYRVNTHTHAKWNGAIEKAVFTLKFPPELDGPFRVTFSRVEFVE